MHLINVIGGLLVDALIYPLRNLDPAWSLTVLSLLTGLLFLLIFKWMSNQEALHEAKQHVKAHLLELVLFAHDMVLSLRAQRDLFLANLRYIRYTLKPIAVLLVPVILLLIQLDVRYAARPLDIGETTLLRVRLAPTVPADTQPDLVLPDGIALDAPPLYIPSEREMDWRLRAEAPGDHVVRVSVGDHDVAKRIRVGGTLRAVAAEVRQPSLFSTIGNPAESPLDADSPIQAIMVDYPARVVKVFGLDVHWLVIFFVMSVGPAYLVKGLFGVEV